MIIIKLIGSTILAVISSVSFGIITNVPKRALVPSAITGGIAWMSYYIVALLMTGIVFPNVVGGFCVGCLGNFFAKKVKLRFQ